MKLPGSIALALGWLAIVGTAAAAGAETNPYDGWIKPGPPPLERFVKPLALSPSQQESLKPIFAAAQAKAATDNEPDPTNTPTPEATRSLNAVREADLRVRLATVLSAEQLATWTALSDAHSARAPRPHSHPAHGHSDMSSGKPADEAMED